MNLIILGDQAEALQKEGAMEKEGGFGVSAATLAAIMLMTSFGKEIGGPAAGWLKRKTIGPSDQYKAKMDMMKSKKRSYDRMAQMPYLAGGAGVGALAGNLLTGGSGWGTAAGGTVGGTIGYNWGENIANNVSDWMSQWNDGGE